METNAINFSNGIDQTYTIALTGFIDI